VKNAYFLISVAFVLFIFSCDNRNESSQKLASNSIEDPLVTNEFQIKYAGAYTVELDNMSSNDAMEVYILRKDGTAKWMYLKNDGSGGANIESEKPGSWKGTETSISITCEGNSGFITEDFQLKQGRFSDTLTGERYLKAKPPTQ
jgi:hypothetical protein